MQVARFLSRLCLRLPLPIAMTALSQICGHEMVLEGAAELCADAYLNAAISRQHDATENTSTLWYCISKDLMSSEASYFCQLRLALPTKE